MEEKENQFEDNFKDFGEEQDFIAPNLEQLNENVEEKEEEIITPDFQEETQSLEEEPAEVQTTQEEKEKPPVAKWEELNKTNDVVKKYIIYIDKENIEKIDNLSVDERNEFINKAIKLKISNDAVSKEERKRKTLITHGLVMFFTVVIFLPFAFYLAHLSIVATFKNYKYSQDNFEKLYLDSFKKNSAYTRLIDYKKKHPSK